MQSRDRLRKTLTAGVLLAVALVAGSVLYPVFPCLDCTVRKTKDCGYCCGKGRATVFDHLKGKRDPDLLHPADLRITAPK